MSAPYWNPAMLDEPLAEDATPISLDSVRLAPPVSSPHELPLPAPVIEPLIQHPIHGFTVPLAISPSYAMLHRPAPRGSPGAHVCGAVHPPGHPVPELYPVAHRDAMSQMPSASLQDVPHTPQPLPMPRSPSSSPCVQQASRLGLITADSLPALGPVLLLPSTEPPMPLPGARGLSQPRTTVEIPLALPPPLLHARTNPYVDLGAHLRYYGMDAEAHEFAMSQTTCEFVLTAFLTMYAAPGDKSPAQVSRAGETILFQLEHAAHAHGAEVYAQLSAHAARFHVRSGAVSIPLALHLPWGYGTPPNDALPLPPTHFLAVCKQTGVSRPDDACVAEPPCTLVPIHWIVYVLQCAHLPVPTPGVGGVPVLMCPVPFPEHWALLHRWLYTRDASKLLASLLPLGALRAQCTPAKVVTTHAAVDALAALSLATLVRVLLRIRATWHNGRAVGIYADAFWVTLQRAWDLGVCAVVVRMGRMQVARTEVHSA